MFYFHESSVFERLPTTSVGLGGIVLSDVVVEVVGGNLACRVGAGQDFSLIHVTLHQ